MTPGKTTVAGLRDYLNKQKSNDAPYQFSCDIKEIKVHLSLKEFDKFSFIVDSLRVSRSDELGPDAGSLRKQSDFLKTNLTYLPENLEVFELDTLQSKAQLRSHIPREDDATLSYFEIMIEHRGTISLERTVFDKRKKQRKVTTFQMSQEILERTINDFVRAIELAQ